MLIEGSCVAEMREYLPSGFLTKERTQIGSKKQFSTQSTYSVVGKLKTYTDVHSQKLEIQYDQFGRPKQVVQGGLGPLLPTIRTTDSLRAVLTTMGKRKAEKRV